MASAAQERRNQELQRLRVAVAWTRVALTGLQQHLRSWMSNDAAKDGAKHIGTILKQLPTTLGQEPPHKYFWAPDYSHPNQNAARGWYQGQGWMSYCDGRREYVWQAADSGDKDATIEAVRDAMLSALCAPVHHEIAARRIKSQARRAKKKEAEEPLPPIDNNLPKGEPTCS